jgi:hypothetical protein
MMRRPELVIHGHGIGLSRCNGTKSRWYDIGNLVPDIFAIIPFAINSPAHRYPLFFLIAIHIPLQRCVLLEFFCVNIGIILGDELCVNLSRCLQDD